jgi:hypothetical protein
MRFTLLDTTLLGDFWFVTKRRKIGNAYLTSRTNLKKLQIGMQRKK